MLKDSKILIGSGAVLASDAVATVIGSPYLDDTVSPCFDNPVTAMMCRVEAPHIADRHENEPAPLQVQRTMAVAASTTASQFGRTMVMFSMKGELTLTPSSA